LQDAIPDSYVMYLIELERTLNEWLKRLGRPELNQGRSAASF